MPPYATSRDHHSQRHTRQNKEMRWCGEKYGHCKHGKSTFWQHKKILV